MQRMSGPSLAAEVASKRERFSMTYDTAGVLPGRPPAEPRQARWSALEPFIPKSIVCLREGYGRQSLTNDLIGGLTVGIIGGILIIMASPASAG